MPIGKWIATLGLCLFLVGMLSCQQGFDDNERFSSDVSGVTLESPELNENSFQALVNTNGEESVKVTWPVVKGAGGYLFNVAIVDDPSNPVEVVKDSIVDGCSIIFKKKEDTKYEISIKTLGNEKLNNKEAELANNYAYSTLVPAQTIAEGQELVEFVRANLQNSTQEQGLELLGGKTYYLNEIIDFDLNTVTFRGNKANRPTIVLGPNGGLMTQGGLKLKFINFDCTETSKIGILGLSDNPSATISTEALGYKNDEANQNGFVINDPIIIQECNFKNIKNSLLYGNKKPWSLRDFRIVDCIVQLNNPGSSSVIRLDDGGNGLIKDLTVRNSTFLNLVENKSGYFIRYSNASNAQPKKIFGNAGNSSTFTIEHNTFSHVMSGKDFANNMPNTNTLTTKVQYNIFYDVFRVYQILQSQAKRYTADNIIYGVPGRDPQSTDLDRTDTDGKPYTTLEDPDFEGPFEVALNLEEVNGGLKFTPRSALALDKKIGDPRWIETEDTEEE